MVLSIQSLRIILDRRARSFGWLLCTALCAQSYLQSYTSAYAQSVPALAASLDEQVITIPQPGVVFNINLEATLFKPSGDGPFPLAIINHGKAYGDPKLQGRYRPYSAVRYFLQRGYVVLVPMRQGFSKSEGLYIGAGCNVESNGRTQAQDILSALKYISTQAFVDPSRVIVLGQSHGGWTTLALGASSPPPGVKGLVNFAGGLRQEGCTAWQNTLVRAAGGLGADSKLPSLWFYGDNDSFFAPLVWRGMHEAFVRAGGDARLIAFGEFSGDAHAMFGSRIGEQIWQPELSRFLEQIGLPFEINHPEFSRR
jgi:dienelactone hydrolase